MRIPLRAVQRTYVLSIHEDIPATTPGLTTGEAACT